MGRLSSFAFVDGDAECGVKPAQGRHWSVAVAAVIIAEWLLSQGYAVATIVQGIIAPGLGGLFIDAPVVVLGASALAAVLILGACLYYLHRADGRSIRALGVTWARMPLFVLWLGLGLVAALPVVFEIARNSGVDWRAWAQGAAVTSSVTVLQASGEEVLFRGLVLPLLVARYGVRTGVLLSAALFGGWHLSGDMVLIDAPLVFLTTAVFGVTSAILTLHTRSILPAIALHVVWNVGADLCSLTPHMAWGQSFWEAWRQIMPASLFSLDPALYLRTELAPLAIETLLILAICRDTAVRVFART